MKNDKKMMDKKIPCKKCNGTGYLGDGLICGTCNGAGYVTILESRVLSFKSK